MAETCPGCGHPLRPKTAQQTAPLWSPGVAALLSLLIPGAGQMYKGQVLKGLVWLFVIPVGYLMLILPGLFLHLCCIVGASMGDPYRRR
jgi:TM2 domain-containing membrane protein YozV